MMITGPNNGHSRWALSKSYSRLVHCNSNVMCPCSSRTFQVMLG